MLKYDCKYLRIDVKIYIFDLNINFKIVNKAI